MNRTRVVALGFGISLILFLAGVVWAGSSDNYAVDWQVLSGGGAPSDSGFGDVTLNGSLGQTAIGPSASSGGNYDLGAGYWYGAEGGGQPIYLPIILRGY